MSPTSKKRIMTSRQRAVIVKVANSNQAPHNTRAKALLAVDDGIIQSVAAEQNGLTRDIVKYWLMKFRKSGVAIFPVETRSEGGERSTKTTVKKAEQSVSSVVNDNSTSAEEKNPDPKKKKKKEKSNSEPAKEKVKKKKPSKSKDKKKKLKSDKKKSKGKKKKEKPSRPKNKKKDQKSDKDKTKGKKKKKSKKNKKK